MTLREDICMAMDEQVARYIYSKKVFLLQKKSVNIQAHIIQGMWENNRLTCTEFVYKYYLLGMPIHERFILVSM